MPRNVEIKARLRDLEHVAAIAGQLANTAPEVIVQEDVFFPCETGRLKLRIFNAQRAELIYYCRPDHAGPKTSTYQITPTSDPSGLRAALAEAYGVRAVVSKTRALLLVGRTRIHLDRVDSLGDFLELEVVLDEDEPIAAGQAEAENLMTKLGIGPDDLVADAYVDLLERQNRQA